MIQPIDWSATIAGIALIVALISPFITALVNNRHYAKMKKIELFYQKKISVVESYLRAAANAQYTNGVPNDFAEYSALVLVYAPRALHEKIIQLNRALEGDGFERATADLLYDVAIALQHETKIR